MKIILIVVLFFIQNVANASAKLKIINNLQQIKNLKFIFQQKINENVETGKCLIEYPKKIFCEYDDIYNKILVSNGKSLIINSDRSKQYYRYKLERTPLNLILDKNFLIQKIQKLDNKTELDNVYSFKLEYEDNFITVYFDKKNFNLTGWTTTDIYQNVVETQISNTDTNLELDEKIFNIQKYIN